MHFRSGSLWALLVSSTALAQTSAVGGEDLSRGTTVLPGSAALTDEATSLVLNPAGLGRVGRLNAWYFHERSNVRNQDNDGLWLATSVGDFVGLGVSVQWLRPGPSGTEARQQSSFGLSVGPNAFSLGASLHWFRGGPVQSLTALDIGFQFRPSRWFSAAAFVRNVNAPSNDQTTLGREWTLGVGVRPWNERLTLAIDWVANERSLASSRLQYTLQLNVLGGVRLMAGVSHSFLDQSPIFFHGGIGVDFDMFGYTQGVAYAAGQLNWQFAGRFSLDSHESVITRRKIGVVSLSELGGSPSLTVGSVIGLTNEDRYLQFLQLLDLATQDQELQALVIKVENSGLGLARADEIRAGIVKLRATGKKVFAYVYSVTDTEYLAISACDGIYAAPQAMILVDGLRTSVTFFGNTAKRYGIDVDVARVGAFKSFPEQFTRPDMSDEQRETINAYLRSQVSNMSARIQQGRGIEPQSWQAAVDEGLKPPRRAVTLKQIDALMTPQQFDEFIGQQVPNASEVEQQYQPLRTRTERWGVQPVIAVIPVLGGISGGKNSTSPLTGETAGASSFIAAISSAASDDAVRAIVLRIDSGGGDALASDLMYRAVLEAKKRKPVVASMGDVAASGGYYVAMGADTILASPSTLTGSIGVFFAKPAIKRLAEEFGTTQVSISSGKLAGITDMFDPWTPEQRQAAQGWIDDFYDSFITEVAASRNMPKAAVDAVARGRVWSGQDALAHGLVDQLGGLSDAIALAKQRANVREPLGVKFYSQTPGLLASVMGAVAPAAVLEAPWPAVPFLPAGLQSLAEQLGAASWLLEKPGVQARLEFAVEIR
jgi:protease-4